MLLRALPRLRPVTRLARGLLSIASPPGKASQSAVIEREKTLLRHTQEILRRNDASLEDIALLQDTQSRIEDLFLIVVVGEFNTGKSTLINALLGYEFLSSGVLPTTSKICVLRNPGDASSAGSQRRSQYFNANMNEIEERHIMPADWLDNVAIVDTPGTNSINLDHDQLTKLIIPRADLVYFITSSERPMSESECAFLSHIHEWGMKVNIVVNKVDILSAAEQASVLSFVAQVSSRIFKSGSSSGGIFGVSSRKALQALQLSQRTCATVDPSDALWRESGFEAFYRHILSTIRRGELIQTKLLSPLAIVERLSLSTVKGVEARLVMLESDERILQMIGENNAAFAEDIKRDVRSYRMHVDALFVKTLYQFDAFIDANVSVFRPLDLLSVGTFTNRFRAEVSGDVSGAVEAILRDISELVAQRARSHAKGVLAFIGERHKKVSGSMVGALNESSFDAARERLFARLEKEATRLVQQASQREKAQSFGEQLSLSATGTLSSLAVSGLLLSQAVDVTGVLAVSGLAIGGLVLVPWRKEAIRKEFRASVEVLKNNLDGLLSSGLEQELTSIMVHINSSVDPYARFVRIEKSRLQEMRTDLAVVGEEIMVLRDCIKAL